MRFALFALFLASVVAMSHADAMVGGTTATGVDDAALTAAQHALTGLNTDANLLSSSLGASVKAPLKLVAVKSVSTQVVAGMNYFLTLTVTDASGNTFDMRATVWSRPWLEAQNSAEAWKVTKAERLDA